MRIKITLCAEATPFELPFNYQPILQAIIYRCMETVDRDYSNRLHQNGYWEKSDGKHYKLFVYSDLKVQHISPSGPIMRVYHPELTWYISSPMPEFLNNIVNSLFQCEYIHIRHTVLKLMQMETIAYPDFSEEMQFNCLGPLTASTKVERKNRLRDYYIRPDDSDLLSSVIRQNLVNKYRRIHGNNPEHSDLDFRFDLDYIRNNKRPVSRLVQVHSGRPDETSIRGFIAPFSVKGNPELIKIGYDAGFGNRNSMGFGMADVLSETSRN